MATTPLLLLLAAGACRRAGEPAVQEAGPVGVSVAIARQATLRDTTTAPGVVVPAADGDWTVYAPGPAQISELPTRELETVETGDVLVRFEIPALAQELAARELAVAQAEMAVAQARADAERLAALFERGLTARNALEAARLRVTTTESQLSQARSEQATTLAGADRAVVRARFPGVVVNVWHAVGDSVRGGTEDPVLRVIDPAALQVAVQLPLGQLARVLPGQSAVVRAIAAQADEPATVVSKAEAADPNVATGEVRIGFVSPTLLPIDTPVSVEILFDQRTDAIVVPADAVLGDETGPYVLVAGDDRRARRRVVRTGLSTAADMEILEGVAPGERVIVGGASEVADGTEVAFRD